MSLTRIITLLLAVWVCSGFLRSEPGAKVVWKGLELSEKVAGQLGDESWDPGELQQSFPVGAAKGTVWNGGRGEWIDHQWSAGSKGYNWALVCPVRVPEHKDIDRPIELHAWDQGGRHLGAVSLPLGPWRLIAAGDGVLALAQSTAYVGMNHPFPLIVQDIHYFSSRSPVRAALAFFGASGYRLSPSGRWLVHQDPFEATITFVDLIAEAPRTHKTSQFLTGKPSYQSELWDGIGLLAIADDGTLLVHDSNKTKVVSPEGKVLAALPWTLEGEEYVLVPEQSCYRVTYRSYERKQITEKICPDAASPGSAR